MKTIKTLITIVAMTFLMAIPGQAKQLWGLVAEFKTEDMVKMNTWSQIGIKGMGNEWLMIEKDTGDIEVGYIASIMDTENPEIKKVGFLYEKTCNYKVDYNDINFYVCNMTNNFWEPRILSLRLNYQPFPIDMDYKG